jgi:Big-like domain-containing protein
LELRACERLRGSISLGRRITETRQWGPLQRRCLPPARGPADLNGSTYATGNATHSLTLYQHASGALVFGAGTPQWSWGLDSTHDRGSAAADTAVRQATVNLFSDMGVQPGSLQAGLVPGTPDATAPTSMITAPASGAMLTAGVAVSVTGTASDVGGQVSKVEVSTNDGATWTTASGTTSWAYQWTPATGPSATLRSRATDTGGNRETSSAPVTVNVFVPPPDTHAAGRAAHSAHRPLHRVWHHRVGLG